MIDREFASIVEGIAQSSGARFPVRFPADSEVVAHVAEATLEEAEHALTSVGAGARAMARMPAWKRSEILRKASDLVASRARSIEEVLTLETGKPIREARVEVDRAATTLLLGAEEARRVGGEIVPMDGLPPGEGRLAEVRRFPVGPVAGITPFNSPFNLAAHKVAGAMAAGCPLILKPSPRTPLTTVILTEMVLEAGWPPESLAVLTGGAEVGEALVRDSRVKAIAFNGAVDVGWHLRSLAGTKRVLLELGGNGAVIVDESADLEWAASRCVAAGYLLAGQVCASVQRVYVHETVKEAFVERVLDHVDRQVVGDPRDEATTMGPLITVDAANRVRAMIDEATNAGAQLLCGGKGDGAFVDPTVLTDTTEDMDVVGSEVFGPVLAVGSVATMNEAFDKINASPYGMQTGIFTSSLHGAYEAYRELDMAGVIVNDVNGYRTDSMPFGGEKLSGLGREGPSSVLDTFTYPKLLVLNLEGR